MYRFYTSLPDTTKPVALKFPESDLEIAVDEMSEPYWAYSVGMESRDFQGPMGQKPLRLRGHGSRLRLHVGAWGSDSRLDAVHVVLGSADQKLGYRFGEIELSVCLCDGDEVVLVKNLTEHAGKGAIVRLNRKASRSENILRRQALVEALGAETLEWEGSEYLVVARLNWENLNRCSASLFHHFILNFLRYAGQVETLRNTPPVSSGHHVSTETVNRDTNSV